MTHTRDRARDGLAEVLATLDDEFEALAAEGRPLRISLSRIPAGWRAKVRAHYRARGFTIRELEDPRRGTWWAFTPPTGNGFQ